MKNRPWAKQVHPLADPALPCGTIQYVHFGDGKEHSFGFATNRLSGTSLCWFDGSPPSVDATVGYIKSVIRDIHKKATSVVAHIGDFKPTTRA